jgi:hypothetical protein
MPAKSAKQQRFMAAVANNPDFAEKVGVPKNVGEEFMKKGYKEGRKVTNEDRARAAKDLMGKMGKPRVKEIDPALDDFASMVNEDKKKMGGGMMKKAYKGGGKVRGCGAVSKKMRPAKMVTMKGS